MGLCIACCPNARRTFLDLILIYRNLLKPKALKEESSAYGIQNSISPFAAILF